MKEKKTSVECWILFFFSSFTLLWRIRILVFCERRNVVVVELTLLFFLSLLYTWPLSTFYKKIPIIKPLKRYDFVLLYSYLPLKKTKLAGKFQWVLYHRISSANLIKIFEPIEKVFIFLYLLVFFFFPKLNNNRNP